MTISILTPCYNEQKNIEKTLQSVDRQTYSDWEMIIVDDGSTDNTYDVVERFIQGSKNSDKYQLIRQPNSDQLIAVKNALSHAKGDFIYVLHGDDILLKDDSLETVAQATKENPGYDAYIAPLALLDPNDQLVGQTSLRPYLEAEHALSLMQLWLGRNLYNDVALVAIDIAKTYYSQNYLVWNTPFWAKMVYGDTTSVLQCYELSEPIYGYRIHEGNYLKNELGVVNVFSGEMRTFLNLAYFTNIPAYRIQYAIFRVLNKVKKGINYRPLKTRRRQKKIATILRFMMQKYAPVNLMSIEPYKSVLAFFDSREATKYADKSVTSPKLPDDFFAPTGAQMLLYNTRIKNGQLHEAEQQFLDLVKTGPSSIYCSPHDVEKLERYLTYLGINRYIKVVGTPD